MQVSDSHKFMFFHIRKTGGTSVAIALGGVSKDPFKDRHLRPSRVRERMPKKFQRYFKFSVVRNPWDRMVSCYSYDSEVTREFQLGGHHHKISFPEYLDLRFHKTGGWWTENQKDFLCIQGVSIVDYIARYEALQKEIDTLCANLGVKAKPLPFKRKTKHGPYQGYYNNASRKLVKEVFSKDVKEFGYTFK